MEESDLPRCLVLFVTLVVCVPSNKLKQTAQKCELCVPFRAPASIYLPLQGYVPHNTHSTSHSAFSRSQRNKENEGRGTKDRGSILTRGIF